MDRCKNSPEGWSLLASVSSDSSAGEALALISIAQTSPSQPARRTGAIVDYAADQGGRHERRLEPKDTVELFWGLNLLDKKFIR